MKKELCLKAHVSTRFQLYSGKLRHLYPFSFFSRIKDIKKDVEVDRMRGDKKSVYNFGNRADTLKNMLQVLKLM
jgi:hypothetical protein